MIQQEKILVLFMAQKVFLPQLISLGQGDLSVSWNDTSGNLWLFGGFGYTINGYDAYRYFNDLWEYDLSSNQWTWMKRR